MAAESDELFFILYAEKIALLRRISRIIIYLKNRPHKTTISNLYLQFFEIGHKILLQQLSCWYRTYSTTTQGNDIYFLSDFTHVCISSSRIRNALPMMGESEIYVGSHPSPVYMCSQLKTLHWRGKGGGYRHLGCLCQRDRTLDHCYFLFYIVIISSGRL